MRTHMLLGASLILCLLTGSALAGLVADLPTDPGAPLSVATILPDPVIVPDDSLRAQGYPANVPFPVITLAQPVQPGYVILLESGSATTQQSLWASGQYDKSLWSDMLVFGDTSCQLMSYDDYTAFPTPTPSDRVRFINEFSFDPGGDLPQYTIYAACNPAVGFNLYYIESTAPEPVTLTLVATGLVALVRRRKRT